MLFQKNYIALKRTPLFIKMLQAQKLTIQFKNLNCTPQSINFNLNFSHMLTTPYQNPIKLNKPQSTQFL